MAESSPRGAWRRQCQCLVTFAVLASDVRQVEGFAPSSSSTATVAATAAATVAAMATSVSAASEYTELPGMRCHEQEDFYPVGHVGGEWTEYLHRQAEKKCNKDPNCVGIMRYIGHDPVHCRFWCGRPQFCNSTQGASLNGLWLSYIKPDKVASLELKPAQEQAGFKEAVCQDPVRISREKVVILTHLMPQLPFEGPSTCYVWWRRYSMGSPLPEALSAKVPSYMSKLSGELVENEQKGLQYLGSDGNFGFPRYYFDGNSLPTAAPQPKTKLMSIFFSATDAVCYGADREREAMTPFLAESLFPGDVYAYDGDEESIDDALQSYQTTLFCGSFASQRFPPPALVRAISLSTFPIVPLWMKGNLSRVQFHLPEAVQTYDPASLDLLQLYATLEHNFIEPGDLASVQSLVTFNALANRLLTYRYGQPVPQRAEAAACALCESRKRWNLRKLFSAAIAEGPESFSEGQGGYDEAKNAVVEFALCSMSQRNAKQLRAAVRSTWASAIRDLPAIALRFFVGSSGGAGGSGSGSGSGSGADRLDLEAEDDVVQLEVTENPRFATLKALRMMEWAFNHFPHLQWFLRLDDDVYLRPGPILEMLRGQAPVFYLWGKIRRGSRIMRDPGHPDYNSFEQCLDQSDPVFGDAFPPYPDSSLWAMSADLMNLVVRQWLMYLSTLGVAQEEELAGLLPRSPDPAVGVALLQVVAGGVSINMDDRYFNYFSSSSSCKRASSAGTGMQSRTWVFEKVSSVEAMQCMWRIDEAARATVRLDSSLPSLCQCAPEATPTESLEGLAAELYPANRFPE